MEQTYLDPAHNLNCRYRFTCAAAECPSTAVTSRPSCYIDRFKRYQPENDIVWYQRNWEDINRITWKEVFSLEESWIYTLLLITIIVLIFMLMLFIKVILEIN